MAQFYAPNFSGLLPLFDGKSAAGGKLYAYKAGSSVPAPLYSEDGTALGSWVSIDSNGCADFLLSSALTYKLVVKDALGATLGEWDNVAATNAPGMTNPLTAEGSLIVGGTAGEPTELPAGSEGQALKIVSGVPAWATDAEGMQNPMTTEGDLIVGGTDGAPSRLGAGTDGHVLTLSSGAPAWAAPATQTGDHKLLTTSADTSAGYLADKLVAGSNVTLTTNTDGDGVQSIEISAAGGGGGGGGSACLQFAPPSLFGFCQIAMNTANTMTAYHISFLRKFPFVCKFSRIYFMIYNDANGAYTTANVGLYYRDTNGDYVAASRQMGLQLKHKLRTGANTGDSVYYIDLATPMDTTDGSRNYKLAVQFISTTKPTTALNFYPDASYDTPPVTSVEQPFVTNGYYLNINNSGQAPQNVWLIQNRYWAENEIGDTLINIPTSPAQHSAMPWMAVETSP